MNHTGHEVCKCARVAGRTKKFVFQWFNLCLYRSFVFHLCIILYFICISFVILYNFTVCNILLNLYVMFYVVSVRYIYSNVWFQCKTSECLVSFKFLSMSCMGSFQWPFHYKKLLLSNKNICWATYLCSCDLFVSFSRAVNYIFFTYLFFIAQ